LRSRAGGDAGGFNRWHAIAGTHMSIAAGHAAVPGWLVILLVVFLVLFALAIVFAAIWYQLRQPKEVRLDRELDEEEDSEEYL
jgi:flagellar basal body-associated protein FliL